MRVLTAPDAEQARRERGPDRLQAGLSTQPEPHRPVLYTIGQACWRIRYLLVRVVMRGLQLLPPGPLWLPCLRRHRFELVRASAFGSATSSSLWPFPLSSSYFSISR